MDAYLHVSANPKGRCHQLFIESYLMSHSKPEHPHHPKGTRPWIWTSAQPSKYLAIPLQGLHTLRSPQSHEYCCPEFRYTEHPRSTGFSHSAYAFANDKCCRSDNKIGEILRMPCDAWGDATFGMSRAASLRSWGLCLGHSWNDHEWSPKSIYPKKITTNGVRTFPYLEEWSCVLLVSCPHFLTWDLYRL